MAGPVALRSDYDARALRRLAKASRDADQTRRLLALAAIYDGSSRRDGAEIGGVGLQTVRDWVLRFNAEGPARLGNGKAPGGRCPQCPLGRDGVPSGSKKRRAARQRERSRWGPIGRARDAAANWGPTRCGTRLGALS